MKKILIIVVIGVFIFIWSTFDAITKVSISTKIRLHTTYFLDEKIVIEWLEKYHGEALNHQVMLTFINWGLTNEDDFNRILKELNDETGIRIKVLKNQKL